jgi:hypothetical protein
MRGFTISMASADAITNPDVGTEAIQSKFSNPIFSDIEF